MGVLRRADLRYPAILALIWCVTWAPRVRGPIDLRFDAGVYYVLGTSLAQGQGYRLLNEPGHIQAVQYPPLLPLFVAAHQKILGTSDPAVVGRWLRLSYCAISLMYSLAVYAMARQFLSAGFAFLVALICTISSDSLYLSDLLFAEVPFALVTVLCVLSARAKPRSNILTGILAGAAFMLRSAGVALLAAWVGEALLKRQWKRAAIRVTIAALPLLAWQGWIMHVKSGDEYKSPAYAYQRAPYQYYNVTYAENMRLIDPFRPELGTASKKRMIKSTAINSLTMPASIGETITMPRSFWYWALQSISEKLGRAPDRPVLPWNAVEIPMILFGAIALSGAVIFARRGEYLVPLYLAASLALISTTPWPKQLTRYFLPLAPFVALCAVQALTSLRNSRLRGGKIICGIMIAMILLIEAGASAAEWAARFNRTNIASDNYAPRLFYFSEKWRSWNDSIEWLKVRAKQDDVIVTAAPHLAHLITGCPAVLPPMELDPDREQQMLDSVPARFLVIDRLSFLDISARYVLPMIKKHPGSWRLIYNAPDQLSQIYERAEAKEGP